jgi:hypothetical protein
LFQAQLGKARQKTPLGWSSEVTFSSITIRWTLTIATLKNGARLIIPCAFRILHTSYITQKKKKVKGKI